MSAILKFDFQKKKTITFFWSKLSNLHKKRPNFACGNYIFPKTRENKNKPWTHSTPLKESMHLVLGVVVCKYVRVKIFEAMMNFFSKWRQFHDIFYLLCFITFSPIYIIVIAVVILTGEKKRLSL